MIQAHIYYSGTVQGVGFRYTAQRLARELELTGWVKNLADRRVEMIVEGPQKTIEQLCKNIETHFANFIKDKQINFSPASQGFNNFRISH